jgi:hypothetical protein
MSASVPSSKYTASRNKLIWAIGSIVVLSLAAWLGWSYYQSRYPSWYEEVQLSDGRIITIHQKREYYENYGTNQSWVTIDLPELGGKRVWHSYLLPQRVDVVDGKVYVFGSPRGDRQYAHYRYPKNFMVGFLWNGNDFDRIPFLNIPERLRTTENVFPCIPEGSKKLVSVSQKNDAWCPPMGDNGQFKKAIDLQAYQALSIRYSRRSGGLPISD